MGTLAGAKLPCYHVAMAFNPMDYPLAWVDPLMLSRNSDFIGHIPFVMSLVELMRPGTLVELGTHTGNSYCAFCQAARSRQLVTRCFAVDTWQGDASMGVYAGDAMFEELRRYHDPAYGSFSTLMRMTFDAALPQIADGSIDLLHIDGCHTYEAVRHDFEAWLPKLSNRGVVILHDTAERQDGFGVWRFWEEVSGRYPAFNFEHCHGLGMLVVGKEPEPSVQQFMRDAATEPERVRQFFGFQGKRIESVHAMRWMVMFAWQVQTTLDEWCASHGRPVNAHRGTLQLAQSQPAGFIYSLNLHTQQVFGSEIRAAGKGPSA